MKYSINRSVTTAKILFIKIYFCAQLVIVSVALPMLYYAGVSHNVASDKNNNNDTKQKHLIITNKGSKRLATNENAGNEIVKYNPAFWEI